MNTSRLVDADLADTTAVREVSEPEGGGEKVAVSVPPLIVPGCWPQSQAGLWQLP